MLDIAYMKTLMLRCLILLLLSLPSIAQEMDYLRFEHFTIEQKISQNDVFCIIQDRYGFLWFGTQDGLNKYDGYDFTVFRHEPSNPNSLSDGYVVALLEDRKGYIWIGTKNSGLNRFDRKKQNFEVFQTQNGLPDNEITKLIQDHEDNIWVATPKGLVIMTQKTNNSWHIDSFEKKYALSLPSTQILDLYQDRQKNIWIATSKGLVIFQSSDKKLLSAEHLSQQVVNCIFEDKKSDFWLGTNEGIIHLDKNLHTKEIFNDEQKNTLSGHKVSQILEDYAGWIWFAFRSESDEDIGGLTAYFPSTQTFKQYKHQPSQSFSLSHNDVLSMAQDQSGTLWIGTLNGGLNKLNKRIKPFVYYDPNPLKTEHLGHSQVRSIYEDEQKNIWVATSSGGNIGGGLKKFVHPNKQIISYTHNPTDSNSISHNGVWEIFPEKNYFWIGTSSGLNKFEPKTGKFIRYWHNPNNPKSISHNFVYDIFKDRQGNLWVGTMGGGLNKILFRNDSIVSVSVFKHQPKVKGTISHNEITCIIQDQEGTIWVGTKGGGLNRLNAADGTFKAYQNVLNDKHTLSHNYINSIYEATDGKLWIATYGGGFCIFDKKTEKFEQITEKNGLPNNVVYGFLPDKDGNLWLSTNKGLSKYKLKTKQFTNYFMREGLQSNEFNRKSFYLANDGRMYFGGVNGFNAFYPETIQENDFIPQIVITDFLLFNEKVPISTAEKPSPLKQHIEVSNEIVLDYHQNFIGIEFAALHFDYPEKIKYAYKMQGIDENWIYTDVHKRFATYTNLSAGEYVFMLKATNSDGIWNENPKTLKITITPPIWRTKLFYFLAALFILSNMYGFFRYREKRYEIRRRNLELMVETRTKEVRSQATLLEAQRDTTQKALKEIEEKNKNITASINYAQRIQAAFLPTDDYIKTHLPNSFVLFKPRDIVSGDFYWFEEHEGLIFVSAIDCTGHGVPGAFMSLIGESLLNETIFTYQLKSPDQILAQLHLLIRKALKQAENSNRDSMDMALCVIDFTKKELQFAGARNPLVYFKEGEFYQLEATRHSVGGHQKDQDHTFELHKISWDSPMTCYLFSDGMQDQFGGDKGRKLGRSAFYEMLKQVHLLPIEEQSAALWQKLVIWKRQQAQIDDILVIGFVLT